MTSPFDGAPQMTPALVKESAFGTWFLGTDTWHNHVITVALDDLQRLLPAGPDTYPVVLDLGCGQGWSMGLLAERFQPQRIVGVDADPRMPGWVAACAPPPCERFLRVCDASDTGLPDDSVDLIFCHQTLHHVVNQEAALAECFRVLRPGGVLLLAESTRKYIRSWMIRLLFRHPMEVQRSAEEYLAMIRAAGFDLPDSRVSLPYLWWSRWDLGTLEWMGIKPPEVREETLLNVVATKPLLPGRSTLNP